jgi:hypothetical protein
MEWDQLQQVAKGQPKVKKPPLVKFIFEQLLKILGISTSTFQGIPSH